jgi:hypothetical protein
LLRACALAAALLVREILGLLRGGGTLRGGRRRHGICARLHVSRVGAVLHALHLSLLSSAACLGWAAAGAAAAAASSAPADLGAAAGALHQNPSRAAQLAEDQSRAHRTQHLWREAHPKLLQAGGDGQLGGCNALAQVVERRPVLEGQRDGRARPLHANRGGHWT